MVSWFRKVLLAVVTVLFFWQTSSSMKKYLHGGVTVNLDLEFPDKIEFPSVTFCPVHHGNEGADDGDPFKPVDLPDFAYGYTTTPSKNFTLVFDPEDGSLAPDWQSVRKIGYSTSVFALCLSYHADALVADGLESAFTVYLDSAKFSEMLIYVHDHQQNLLSPGPIYGSTFVQLDVLRRPADETEKVKNRYMITPGMLEDLPSSELPCHPVNESGWKESTFLGCIDRHFERSEGCSLPWTGEEGAGGEAACEDTESMEAYKDLIRSVCDKGPLEIYHMTGCYYSCVYATYELKHTLSLVSPKKAEYVKHPYDHEVSFFLAPGGVTRQLQVPTYDLGGLIGDVGGSLGLFLGASILSLYDEFLFRLKALVKMTKVSKVRKY